MDENSARTVAILDQQNIWWSFFGKVKSKLKNPNVQKYTKNIGWMFFARIASMVVSFLSTMYIARELGPSNYGELSYAVSFTALFGFIASFGIDQILTRDLIKFPDKRNIILGSAFFLKLLFSILAIIICALSALIFSPNDVSLILIILISSTFVINSLSFFGYEFQADANAKLPSITSVFILIILNLSKIAVIYFGGGVIYLAGIIVLDPILYGINYVVLRTKFYGSLTKITFEKNTAIRMLKDSLPLVFVSAFYMIYARIDQVFIKNMINSESVGLYDSAVRISELWFFIPNIVIAGLFPAIMNAQNINRNLFLSRNKKLILLIFLIATFTSFTTVLLSGSLINIIFGDKYIAATVVLQIYVMSNIGAALNQVSQQILIAENLSKTIAISSFVGMSTNVILCILLIKPYGMEGAAFASLISYSIQFFAIFMMQKSRRLFIDIFKSNLEIKSL